MGAQTHREGLHQGVGRGSSCPEAGSQRDSRPGRRLMSVLENRSLSVARQQEKEVSVPGKVARWRDARALTHS